MIFPANKGKSNHWKKESRAKSHVVMMNHLWNKNRDDGSSH